MGTDLKTEERGLRTKLMCHKGNHYAIDVLYCKAGYRSRKHYHKYKSHKIIVLSGELDIETSNGISALDEHETMLIPSNLIHQLYTYCDSIILEIDIADPGKFYKRGDFVEVEEKPDAGVYYTLSGGPFHGETFKCKFGYNPIAFYYASNIKHFDSCFLTTHKPFEPCYIYKARENNVYTYEGITS